MHDSPHSILFLCNRNATRGILAEALLRRRAGARFEVYSAGCNPSGSVNPAAVALLKRLKISAAGLRSKSWSEFVGPAAPHLDIIISLCDKTSGEVLPPWPDHAVTAQWSIPDPADAVGSPIDKARHLREVFSMIERRISLFLSLPEASIEKLAVATRMRSPARQ